MALIQSLVKEGVVDERVGDYGHLIVDECHHLSAQSFERVARQAKGRFVTGLSATIARKDGHHPIICMQCGPVRYRVNAKAQAAIRPFAHVALVQPTSFHPRRASHGGFDSAASRAYYAAFHAASALFALEGRTFTRHSALEAAVHRDLVKAERWPADLGRDYSFSNVRGVGDYGDEVRVDAIQAEEATAAARRILEVVSEAMPKDFPRLTDT